MKNCADLFKTLQLIWVSLVLGVGRLLEEPNKITRTHYGTSENVDSLSIPRMDGQRDGQKKCLGIFNLTYEWKNQIDLYIKINLIYNPKLQLDCRNTGCSKKSGIKDWGLEA